MNSISQRSRSRVPNRRGLGWLGGGSGTVDPFSLLTANTIQAIYDYTGLVVNENNEYGEVNASGHIVSLKSIAPGPLGRYLVPVTWNGSAYVSAVGTGCILTADGIEMNGTVQLIPSNAADKSWYKFLHYNAGGISELKHTIRFVLKSGIVANPNALYALISSNRGSLARTGFHLAANFPASGAARLQAIGSSGGGAGTGFINTGANSLIPSNNFIALTHKFDGQYTANDWKRGTTKINNSLKELADPVAGSNAMNNADSTNVLAIGSAGENVSRFVGTFKVIIIQSGVEDLKTDYIFTESLMSAKGISKTGMKIRDIERDGTYKFTGEYLRNPVNGKFIHLTYSGNVHTFNPGKKGVFRTSSDNGLTHTDWADLYNPLRQTTSSTPYTIEVTTSSTSINLATAPSGVTLTVATGKSYVPGDIFRVESRASTNNYLQGTCTSYNSGSGELILGSVSVGGSGTFTDWDVRLANNFTITVGTGLSYDINYFVYVISRVDEDNRIIGSVVSYNSGTGELVLSYVKSYQSGGTFSDWDVRDTGIMEVGGGYDNNGRLHLFICQHDGIGRVSDGGSGSSHKLMYMYSDDDGTTVSTAQDITYLFAGDGKTSGRAHGKLRVCADGTLIKPVNRFTESAFGNNTVGLLRSVDGGATWTLSTVDANNTTDALSESTCITDGNTVIFVSRREEESTPVYKGYRFYKSTDSGATWTAIGNTNFSESNSDITSAHPSEIEEILINGQRVWLFYYNLRGKRQIKRVAGLPADVVADAVNGWNLDTKKIFLAPYETSNDPTYLIGTGTSGYGGFIHKDRTLDCKYMAYGESVDDTTSIHYGDGPTDDLDNIITELGL